MMRPRRLLKRQQPERSPQSSASSKISKRMQPLNTGFARMLFSEPDPQAEKLHDLVIAGNVDAVKEFIEAYPTVNVNWCNPDCHSALVLAVKAEDEAMVLFLLSLEAIRLGDAPHHAAKTAKPNIMRALLSHPRYLMEVEEGWIPDSDEFDSDSTPIMIAAIEHNYEMVRALMEQGMCIPKPHPPTCFCSEQCQRKIFGESLDDARDRLRAYKAYTSPAYILLAFNDPILAIFNVSSELHECACMEKEFKREYEELAERVSDVAVCLLENCNDTDEVLLLLRRKTPPYDPLAKQLKAKVFCRFAVAVDCKQRKFVAHPHCQQVIRGAWLEGSQEWRTKSALAKLMHIIGLMFFLPVFAFVYLVCPEVSFVKELQSPLHKFLSFSASYVTFLIVLHAQYELDFHQTARGPPNTGLEWYIVAYVLGYILRTLDELLYYESRHFFRQKWNWFDLFMEFCFIVTFVCWAISLIDIYKNGEADQPRDFWPSYDVTLIGEIFYSYAFVLAFSKLLYFLSTSSEIGPMQTIIGQMGGGIFSFTVMFVLIMFAFSAGLVQLLHPYSDKTITLNGQELRSSAHFLGTLPAMKALFWAIFGYSPPADVTILPTKRTYVFDNSTVTLFNHHGITETFGHILFVLYYVVGIIIMINMLIAIMSDVFQRITESADMEWKFGRSRIWLRHLQPGCVLPPPYNLLPNFRSILHWTPKLLGCSKNNENALIDQEDVEYRNLMEKLIRRYMRTEGKKYQVDLLRLEISALAAKLKILLQEMALKGAAFQGATENVSEA